MSIEMVEDKTNIDEAVESAKTLFSKDPLEAVESIEVDPETYLGMTEDDIKRLPPLPEKRRTVKPPGTRMVTSFPPNVKPDPRYVYRWVADRPREEGKQLTMREHNGWEVVRDESRTFTKDMDQGEQVNKASQLGSAVTKSSGGGVISVLMRKPRKWAEESERERQAVLDEKESYLLKGPTLNQGYTRDNEPGVKITRQRV